MNSDTPNHTSLYGSGAIVAHTDQQHSSGSKHYYNGHDSHDKTNNQLATSDSHPKIGLSQQQQEKQQAKPAQQKSSRRTTSLLNLFMSNSQGMNDRYKTNKKIKTKCENSGISYRQWKMCTKRIAILFPIPTTTTKNQSQS